MYVITGASGNTGSVVANELLAKGQQVRVIGRNESRLRPFADKGAEPFVADLTDQAGLRNAFSGAKAVYAMIPPDHQPTGRSYLSEPHQRSDCRRAGAGGGRYVVSLSSIGADKSEGTGPVVGLRRLEQRLNGIPGLNVLHLRAGYFMENTLAQVWPIQTLGFCAGPLDPDLKVPMIATRDIGMAAADALLKLEFEGQQTRELLGQRDLTYTEVAGIIGRAIGETRSRIPPHLRQPVQGRAFVQMGMSLNMANLLLEMCVRIELGLHAGAGAALGAQHHPDFLRRLSSRRSLCRNIRNARPRLDRTS